MGHKDKTKVLPTNEPAALHKSVEDLEGKETSCIKADAALMVSETRYRRLFETAQDGILLINADTGQILDVNPFLLKLLGYSHNDFLGKKLWEIGPFRDTAASRLKFSELQEKGYVRYMHLPLETSDGRLIHVEFVSNVYLVDHEKIIQCNIRDITLRKQTDEALGKAYDEMELRVQERTRSLAEANQRLLLEIEERRKAEDSLLKVLKEVKQLKDKLRNENLYLQEKMDLIHSHEKIIGNSERIRTVLRQIEQVAGTDSTVLIQGETGTGKELVANAIHNLSARKDRIIIKVNCAALPPTLIESELFGREKGAFTGALLKQIGRFELADTSTIFLDEIDSLPMELQVKLLRVLESGEFERLGSPHTVKVNIRIISAANRDLAEVVRNGGFREDLYYRLNVFKITVPPLRERPEDILPLVWSFVQEFGKMMGKRIESIPQRGVEAVHTYPWPGNVRELRNVTERAMIITTGPVLHLEVPSISQSGSDQSGTLEAVEKQCILDALETTKWRVSGKNGAAEILGINPKTLESRMQRLGIQRNKLNS